MTRCALSWLMLKIWLVRPPAEADDFVETRNRILQNRIYIYEERSNHDQGKHERQRHDGNKLTGGTAGSMKIRRFTIILACITLLVLVLSAPASLRDAYHRGGFYLFSRDFIEDIPKRLAGPGRFRFILQPLVATVLGIRSGLADARAGRPPYLWGVLFHRDLRGELVKTGLATVANLVLMGILLDSVLQWLILGASYPGAALVVGPLLIMAPYSVARALSNRLSHRDRDACGRD